MFCEKSSHLESRNFIDGIDFSKNDPCIFVVYPAGAVGDLLVSIIDKHYIRTGCEYYGISSENGKVHIYTADYEQMDLHKLYNFNEQWFYTVADKLAERNLNYSLLDQIIFACHMYKDNDVKQILNTFPNAKVIRINPIDNIGEQIIDFNRTFKLSDVNYDIEIDFNQNEKTEPSVIEHPNLLDIPFGSIFNKKSYHTHYDKIVDFLDLEAKLIRYEFIEYYLSNQHSKIQYALKKYSKNFL